MFTWYNLFKFVHISAVIVWMGGAIVLAVLNARLVRERDEAALGALGRQAEFLGRTLMGPSALLTLVAGGILVGLGGGRMALWTVWGLVGVVGSIAIGAGFMQRAGRELAEVSAAGRRDDARLLKLRRRLALLGTTNIALLLSTVWAMVFKPTL